ncbi:metal-dependent transcriptional regulator [Kiritimatiella glycovorans]|uniref:Transcriptional regulator MntR n=1 Tax=Kiritimatiella glycovorans TaxID=1307763 RepID=A0A0G3EL47_9BACT|nr:metal-dependent transcriptional regulator [Kiritimatiella glycovorans]AKJ64854.1 DtxR family transcriptional regulator [Kiritimatiella glycovorans]
MAAMTEALSISIENYLETIFLLIQEHTVARSKDISERLSVNRSSVTGMLQTLRDRGLVNHERYGYVTLTKEGADIAQRVRRRHEALRDFMVNVLSIDEVAADEAACNMEHGISNQIVDRFVDFAEFVKTCPEAAHVEWVKDFGYRCERHAQNEEPCKRCGSHADAKSE